MINKVKNFFKNFERRIDKNYFFMQDQMAMTQLLKMFDGNFYFPLTSWSICPTEIVHICNDIVINRRRNIVEFGSGLSTICIARLLKINGIKATFTSVENNSEWAEELRSILKNLELDEFVNIVVAPISNISGEYSKEKNEKWYDTAILEKNLFAIEGVDLVVVDGPFWRVSDYARYPAIPFLKNRLGTSFTVFLDDCNRKIEKSIIEDWESILNGNFTVYSQRYATYSKNALFGTSPYGSK